MDYFTIGTVVNTQGLWGEIRVLPSTDDPCRFGRLKEVELFTQKGEKLILSIQRARLHKQFVILKFKEVNTFNDAEKLRGYTIKIPRDLALPLESDEYYMKDLFGMMVCTEEGEALGEIIDVYQTGANDVYAVSQPNGKALLIPAIKQCVLCVDVRQNKMTVRLMEGLR